MRYHFVLTLQWVTPNGTIFQTKDGTATIQPGGTRDNVLQNLIAQMQEGKFGVPTVLFFSVEPNELGV
ncbi:hypothetical protein BJF79_30675 [Actinomadura sp. CNU-125]|uniref:hypothetical protein n=1 Tax=Actinomadura sp. CNU-125 TaxID=1904961 RepID=UPI00095C7FC2|nr:hypothetical protein [Actinomadura sp. CNU-125]OLT36738.1 hypothetical protein BJF79_30675 [Actinomadura sp. CNU-125]